jgi:CDP-paratose synthetase
MRRVLITGITGYIGSKLARELLTDCEVYGLVRKPLNLKYIADIVPNIQFVYYDGSYDSMSEALKLSQPDLVYHMAAYYTGSHGPEHIPKLLDSNITLGAHLLGAMAEHKISALVYASTIVAHYQGSEYRPLNLYAATKQAFSDLLAYYTDIGLVCAVSVVISDTYGPGDNRPKILNIIKQATKTGEKVAFSSGEQVYDVIYIDDLVSAFRMAGEQLLQGVYQNAVFQAVPESPLSLRETVEKLLQVNGLKLNAGWGERPVPEREIREKIRLYPTVPNWEPQISLEEGLRRMCEQDET